MFEYTCPQCQATNRVPGDSPDKVNSCPECRQPLRVVLDDDSGETSGGRKGLHPALLSVGGGLAGLTVAAVVLLVWFFAGAAPVPVENRPALQEIKDWLVSSKPDKKENKNEVPKEGSVEPPTPEYKTLSQEELYDRMLKSVCWIVVAGREQGKLVGWSGSGSLVDRDERLIVTNEHVVPSNAEAVTVFFPIFKNGKVESSAAVYEAEAKAGKGFKAKLARLPDRKRDLSLIQLEQLPQGVLPLRLASRPARPGQKVYTVGGKPRGNQGLWIFSPGTVRQITPEKWNYGDGFLRSADVVASNVPINPGDSGGALVDERGRMVGVNCSVVAGNANYRHINLNEVSDFISLYFRSLGKPWNPPVDDEPMPGAEQKLAKLMEDLDAADNAARKRAVQGIAVLGPDARGAIPKLLQLRRNRGESDDLREAAGDALAAIGPPAREQVNDVIEALSDMDVPEARRYAAGVLGPMAAKDSDILNALLRALKTDKDVQVVAFAATSLGAAGPASRDKVEPELVNLLGHDKKEVRRAALRALSKFELPEVIDADKEKTTLADSSASIEARIYSLFLLSKKGEEVASAIGETLATDTDETLAIEILEALARINAKTKDVGLALSRGMDHKLLTVRIQAVATLVQLGFDAALVPAFLKALASPEEVVRRVVLVKMPNFTTFYKDAAALSVTKESLDSIKKALASPRHTARWVAAYALGTLGEEGVGAVPDLWNALRKESKENTIQGQLEMLSAFGLIGPKAMEELGDKGDELLDLMLEFANDTRDSNRNRRTCAAWAVVKLAPMSKQAAKCWPVLAHALLLKNAPPPTGVSLPPAPTDYVERELHERAKDVLARGGRPAARAIASTFNSSFWSIGAETPAVVSDKIHARRSAFEVLTKIGTDANVPEVRKIFTALNTYLLKFKGREHSEVVQAAKEAVAAVMAKPTGK